MLAVLEAVAQFDEPVAAVDLIPRLQLPRATVHRIAVTLERLGYLHREPGSKRFTIGFRQQRLALASLINSATRGARHAILQSLVADVGETCNVTVLDGNEVAYIDRVESDWPLRTHLQPGSRVPIHCGASGMMFLSAMPASKRRAILRSAPLRKFTDKTVIDPDRIEENLRQIRRNDVAIEVEEFMQGLIGLAVPVRDRTGRLCATVSMHAPTARFTVEQVLAQVPALRKAAAAVEQLLDPVDQSANARDANEVKRSGARGATRSARVTDKR
ncbi:MAG TPA: IclR family transcriptional regulator [Casimicrobiaceae bacterium]|nr:IclR family transcriptional regulator [Casimicrobiaceae bacterium]